MATGFEDSETDQQHCLNLKMISQQNIDLPSTLCLFKRANSFNLKTSSLVINREAKKASLFRVEKNDTAKDS